MISFDFEYYKPASLDEAVFLFQQAEASGKAPRYYSGGSEIISMARLNKLRTGAVIDVKDIAECKVMQLREKENVLVIGAALTLTELEESGFFPLLADTSRDVADRTNRNRITLGGNLCGAFIYREVLLPFLLADSEAVLAGPAGVRRISVHELLNGQPRLARGDLLVQLITGAAYTHLPYVTVKKTKMERIDYPIVRIAALRSSEGVRAAFSGVSSVPFRSRSLENILNEGTLPLGVRVENVIRSWPLPIMSDLLGSSDYRAFVLRNTLYDVMTALEERGEAT
ncbi:FAD binding domain-containing protein [Bacillus sp. 3255]|uniref:FAD binding domain-containing protein n=1 Tax=Bacillus sp. 3255 TaxID=2817904 RepID=UPI0028564CBF|nr:FAD binding domain-containing protein [Bacillus sp. 3255]MDR6879784.1 CO/xanthine dehydrogenase FAD-binding subunit [Bacillus sp. 3255]